MLLTHASPPPPELRRVIRTVISDGYGEKRALVVITVAESQCVGRAEAEMFPKGVELAVRGS